MTAGMYLASSIEEYPLLMRIKNRFNNIGSIYKIGNKAIRWMVGGLKDIVEIILPFMDKYTLWTEKAIHYKIFKEVCLKLYKNNK